MLDTTKKLKWLILIAVSVIACKVSSGKHQMKADAAGINKTINLLYRSFSFDAGKEPDYDAIQSVTLKGAVFVSAPNNLEERKALTVEELIENYKKSVRKFLPTKGYQEQILTTHIRQSGTVANVEVQFKATIPGDTRKRKTGLDNIQLLLVNGKWMVVAFTTQSESTPIAVLKSFFTTKPTDEGTGLGLS